MNDNGRMPYIRRHLLFLGLLLLCAGRAHAQVFWNLVPVPRHAAINNMPMRISYADSSQVMKALTDPVEDAMPSSIASAQYSMTAGNTYGPATNKQKAEWYKVAWDWLMGTPGTPGGGGKPGALQRATAEIERSLTWLDDLVGPELTMRTEQMADFQRALKAYQLFRQMEVMARSWRGSLFKFDLLDIIPVYEQQTLDDMGIPVGGIRVGLKYKDSQGKGDLLSNFGLDNPFVGPWDSPRLRYKGPRKLSDISFDIQATPFDGTSTDSEALRIGKSANEMLDRTFFEGIMGQNMANRGVYYSPKANLERPSPKLLQTRAEEARNIRMSQIIQEAEAYSKAYGVPMMDALNYFKDELEWWRAKPQALYENQMRRLNRYRDEIQTVNNDISKLDAADKLAEESDPDRKNFLDKLYNLYSQIGDSTTSVVNAATGKEDDGDNPSPRQLYKANVAYARATHAAYLESLAIRRYLAAKIQSEAQRGSAQGFLELWKTMQARQGALAKFETEMEAYERRARKVLKKLDSMGIGVDEVIQGGINP